MHKIKNGYQKKTVVETNSISGYKPSGWFWMYSRQSTSRV